MKIIVSCFTILLITLSLFCYGLHSSGYKRRAPWPLLSAVFGLCAFLTSLLLRCVP